MYHYGNKSLFILFLMFSLYQVNGIAILTEEDWVAQPRILKVVGEESGIEYPLSTLQNVTYKPSDITFFFFPVNTRDFSNFKLYVEGIFISRFSSPDYSESNIFLYEMYFLVCNQEVPSVLSYPQDTYHLTANVSYIDIYPNQGSLRGCIIVSSSLPPGLSLDTDSCQIVGIPTIPISICATIEASYPREFTGVVCFDVIVCNGTVLEIWRQYQSDPFTEYYSIYSILEETVIYSEPVYSTQRSNQFVTHHLCVPEGEYRVETGNSLSLYWRSGSFLMIQAVVSELYIDPVVDLNYDVVTGYTNQVFELSYPIVSHSLWYYKLEWDPNWLTADLESWGVESVVIPNSPTQYHLLQRSFLIQNPDKCGMLRLIYTCQYGIAVFINGLGVFSRGVPFNLTENTFSSYSYEEWDYHELTLSCCSLRQGANRLSIALVNSNAPSSLPDFDVILRVLPASIQRVLYGASIKGSPVDEDSDLLIDQSSIDLYRCAMCLSQLFVIDYQTVGAHSITALTLVCTSTSIFCPTSLRIEGRLSPDPWDLISEISNLVWWEYGYRKLIILPSHMPYNQFRISNIKSSFGFTWILTSLDFVLLRIDPSIHEFTYPSITVYVDIQMDPLSPTPHIFINYHSDSLPDGLMIDSATGIIVGMPTSNAHSGVFTITALTVHGDTAIGTVHFTVALCPTNSSRVTLGLLELGNSSLYSMAIYFGTSSMVPIYTYSDFPSTSPIHVFDLCLEPSVYTLKCSGGDSGWVYPSYFFITVNSMHISLISSFVPPSSMEPSVNVFFSTLIPFEARTTKWECLGEGEPSSDWLSSTVPLGWKTTVLTCAAPDDQNTAYFRYIMTVNQLSVYSVLQCEMEFTGGIIMYLNGYRVARFFLPKNVTPDTRAEGSNDLKMKHTSILLREQGAVEGSNVIGVEVHRSENCTAVKCNFTFTMSAIFLVQENCELMNTVSKFEAVIDDLYHVDLSDLVSSSLNSFYIYSLRRRSSILWTFENRERVMFNGVTVYTGNYDEELFYQFYGKTEEGIEQFIPLTSQTIKKNDQTSWLLNVTMMGLNSYQFTVRGYWYSNALINLHRLASIYTKGHTLVCPASDEYPSVTDGMISPGMCPPSYEGYSYRECIAGVLSEVHFDRCLEKAPADLKYETQNYVVVVGVRYLIDRPSVSNIVTHFMIDETTPLPEGFELMIDSGEIVGVAHTTFPSLPIIVYACNHHSHTATEITMQAVLAECPATSELGEGKMGDMAVVRCTLFWWFQSQKVMECVLDGASGVGIWEHRSGICGNLVWDIGGAILLICCILVAFHMVHCFRKVVVKKRIIRRGNRMLKCLHAVNPI